MSTAAGPYIRVDVSRVLSRCTARTPGSTTGLQAVADAAGRIVWDLGVDSTIMRAHRHAAGARHHGDEQVEPPGGVDPEPANHALGRSQGALTTKLHLACEQHRRPLALVLTAGQ